MTFNDYDINDCTVIFNSDGTVSFSGDTETTEYWSINDSIITITFSNAITTYKGKIENNVFSGRATNTKTNREWGFDATLISKPNRQPYLNRIIGKPNNVNHIVDTLSSDLQIANLDNGINNQAQIPNHYAFNDIKVLGYNPHIRQFRDCLESTITVKGKYQVFKSYYIHDYYPKKHFGDKVDNDIQYVRELVYNFKDGQNSSLIASLIIDAINKSNIDLSNSCFVIIPASTPEKTVSRYKNFCDILCKSIHIQNAYESITTIPHSATKGTYGGNKIQYFTFNNSFYRNKNVILFDDVRTSGTTFKQVLWELMNTGTLNVLGIFLAKTVHYLNS